MTLRSRLSSNSVEKNLEVWDRTWKWEEDGDEWKGQSAELGLSYAQWKQTLVDYLIIPYVRTGSTVLEIGPGHGRWTEGILSQPCARVVLVDLSPSCLAFCLQRFSDSRLETYNSTGSDLPPNYTASIDVVWSYDTFVHIAPPQFRKYIMEIYRVLRPGGVAVLHHANRRHFTHSLRAFAFGRVGRRVYKLISIGGDLRDGNDGWRSDVCAKDVRRWADASGLEVRHQFERCGENNQPVVSGYRDRITLLHKPN